MSQQDIYSEIERLNAIDSSYDRRREMEAMSADQLFTANLVIKKIERSYGYIREDGFRDGKTVLGKLVNSDQEIKLSLPQALNEQADSWNEGETIAVNVNLHDYDTAYKRYQVLGRSIESGVPTDTDTTEPENRENQDTQLESITSEVETSDAPEMQRLETQTEELPERIVEPETEPEPVSDSELKSDQDEQEFQEAAPVEQQPAEDFDLNQSALQLPAALPVITTDPAPPPTSPKPNKTRTRETGKGNEKRKLGNLDPTPSATSSDGTALPPTGRTPATGKLRNTKTRRDPLQAQLGVRIIKVFLAIVIVSAVLILLSITIFESVTTTSTSPKASTATHKPSSVISLTNDPPPKGEVGSIPTDHGHGGTPARYIWSRKDDNFQESFYKLTSEMGYRFPRSAIMHPTEPIIFLNDGLTLIARNIETDENVPTPDKFDINTTSVAFSENGSLCMLIMSDDKKTYEGRIFKWPLSSNRNPIVSFPASSFISDAFFGPREDSIIIVNGTGSGFLHKTGKITEAPSRIDIGDGVLISNSSPTFLAGDYNILGIGSLFEELIGHTDKEFSAYKSPSKIFTFRLVTSSRYSDLAATINTDRQIRIFRPPGVGAEWALKGFRIPPKHLDMSHRGTHAVVLQDHERPELLIVNLHTAEVTARLQSPSSNHFKWCEFSPNSRYVYAFDSNEELVFWRIQEDWIVYTPEDPTPKELNRTP